MSVEWLLIRGSGILSFALISASVIWGLLVSTGLVGRLVKVKALTWFHESLGIAALVAALVHVVVLSMHDYLKFTWAEILIPGESDWRPLAVAFGIMALYALLVVVISFYVKKRIGHKTWRAIHYASFGVFLASMLHGITAGTDTRAPIVLGLYLGSALAVGALMAVRLRNPSPSSPAVVRAPRAVRPDELDGKHDLSGAPAVLE